MKKKTITCKPDMPFSQYPHIDTAWDDFPIYFYKKNKKQFINLTIVRKSEKDFEEEISWTKKIIEEIRADKDTCISFSKDLDILTTAKKQFNETDNKYFISESPDSDYFEIWVNCNKLNKKEIEKTIEWYLRKTNSVGKVELKFSWIKPELIIYPM
jgi:hypothetical protein